MRTSHKLAILPLAVFLLQPLLGFSATNSASAIPAQFCNTKSCALIKENVTNIMASGESANEDEDYAVILTVGSTGQYSTISRALEVAQTYHPSATNPVLIQVDVGEFIESIQMIKYVDIQGAGIDATIIQAPTSINNEFEDDSRCSSVTVTGASNTTLSDLTIVNNNSSDVFADCSYGQSIGYSLGEALTAAQLVDVKVSMTMIPTLELMNTNFSAYGLSAMENTELTAWGLNVTIQIDQSAIFDEEYEWTDEYDIDAIGLYTAGTVTLEEGESQHNFYNVGNYLTQCNGIFLGDTGNLTATGVTIDTDCDKAPYSNYGVNAYGVGLNLKDMTINLIEEGSAVGIAYLNDYDYGNISLEDIDINFGDSAYGTGMQLDNSGTLTNVQINSGLYGSGLVTYNFSLENTVQITLDNSALQGKETADTTQTEYALQVANEVEVFAINNTVINGNIELEAATSYQYYDADSGNYYELFAAPGILYCDASVLDENGEQPEECEILP